MHAADEGVSIAIVRGLTYERSEKGIRDIAYPTPMLRKALNTALWENLKFRLASKLASLFLRKQVARDLLDEWIE